MRSNSTIAIERPSDFAVNDLRHTLDSSIYTKTVQDEFGRQVMQFVDKISQADSDGINQRAKLTLMLHEADSLRSRPDADVETVRERYAQAIARAEEIDRNETTGLRPRRHESLGGSREARRFRDVEPTVRQGVRGLFEVARDCRTCAPSLREQRSTRKLARKGFVARSLDSLGWVTYHLGKPAEAIELFNRSLALYAEVMASRRDEENLVQSGRDPRSDGDPSSTQQGRTAGARAFRGSGRHASRAPRPRAEEPVLQAGSVERYWISWAMRNSSWDNPMTPRNRTTNHSP